MPLENGWTFVFFPVAAAKLLAHGTRYVSHLMAQVLHFESSWIPVTLLIYLQLWCSVPRVTLLLSRNASSAILGTTHLEYNAQTWTCWREVQNYYIPSVSHTLHIPTHGGLTPGKVIKKTHRSNQMAATMGVAGLPQLTSWLWWRARLLRCWLAPILVPPCLTGFHGS